MRKETKLSLIGGGVAILVAAIGIVPSLTKNLETQAQPAAPLGISVSGNQHTVLVGNNSTVTVASDPIVAQIAHGVPQSETLVLSLNSPLESQLRVFAEDKITFLGGSGSIRRVHFGSGWMPFDFNRTYMVQGFPNQPIAVMIDGEGEFKVEIAFTRYRDRKRDIRSFSPGVPGIKK